MFKLSRVIHVFKLGVQVGAGKHRVIRVFKLSRVYTRQCILVEPGSRFELRRVFGVSKFKLVKLYYNSLSRCLQGQQESQHHRRACCPAIDHNPHATYTLGNLRTEIKLKTSFKIGAEKDWTRMHQTAISALKSWYVSGLPQLTTTTAY